MTDRVVKRTNWIILGVNPISQEIPRGLPQVRIKTLLLEPEYDKGFDFPQDPQRRYLI